MALTHLLLFLILLFLLAIRIIIPLFLLFLGIRIGWRLCRMTIQNVVQTFLIRTSLRPVTSSGCLAVLELVSHNY